MREFEGTLRLQGIGIVEGIKAINLKVGDYMVFNFGGTEEVTKIELNKTGKTLLVTVKWFKKLSKLVDNEWIGEWVESIRKIRVNTIVAVKELNSVQKPSIVEQIKTETENIIQATKNQEPSEALNSIEIQLDKVTNIINENINNEEIRLQLRDIENDLKWHYGSLNEMVEEQNNNSNSDILDLTGVNFNNINNLIPFISNWDGLSQKVQEAILKANNFYFFGNSLMLYIDSKGYAEALITTTDGKVDIDSIGFKDGLQWNEYDKVIESRQESKLKITIDGEGYRKKVSYNNFKGANHEIALRCDQL